MAQVDQLSQTKEITDFLVRIREYGTPLRVHDETETYYVLTAAQLLKLIQPPAFEDDVDTASGDEPSFALVDFGLTEEDLAVYEAQKRKRQLVLGRKKQRPLDADLKQRLDTFRHSEKLSPQATKKEQEQLLQELEAIMEENFRVVLPSPQ